MCFNKKKHKIQSRFRIQLYIRKTVGRNRKPQIFNSHIIRPALRWVQKKLSPTTVRPSKCRIDAPRSTTKLMALRDAVLSLPECVFFIITNMVMFMHMRTRNCKNDFTLSTAKKYKKYWILILFAKLSIQMVRKHEVNHIDNMSYLDWKLELTLGITGLFCNFTIA